MLIMSGAIALSWHDGKMVQEAIAEARHARSVLDLNETVLSAMKDAEIGGQGFLLTGDKKYLEPYQRALASIPGNLNQLQTLTRDDPQQAERVTRVGPMVSKVLAELEQAIEARENQGLAAGEDLAGKQSMDRIRELSGEIKNAETAALTARRDARQLHGERTRTATLVCGLALFVLFLIAGVMVSRAAAQSDSLIADLRVSEKRAAEMRDLLQTTLNSIGDAVVVTDVEGRVTFINPIAQGLVQYTQKQAAGMPVAEVFRIINEETRETVESPVTRVLREGTVVGLANGAQRQGDPDRRQRRSHSRSAGGHSRRRAGLSGYFGAQESRRRELAPGFHR